MPLKELFDRAQFVLVWEGEYAESEPDFMDELWSLSSKSTNYGVMELDTVNSCYRFSNEAEAIPVQQGIYRVKNEDYEPNYPNIDAKYFYLVFLTTI